MPIAHTLHKMQELTLLLTLTLAKNGCQSMNSFKSNGELGIGAWELCPATLKEKYGKTLMYMYMYKSCLAKAFQRLSTREMFYRESLCWILLSQNC